MDISYNWLQEYIEEDLPDPTEVARVLTDGAYEVEAVTAVDDDHVLDVDVLPNRASDSLGHLGVARELSVLAGLTFVSPLADVSDVSEDVNTADALTLGVESDHCRRAMKRLVVDVAVGPSPAWLKGRLETLGQKSINNIVDITNFLMLETGQPVHAFDYDKLAGEAPKEVVVREAHDGEAVETLDGDTYELEEGMLVIADGEKALDIAGIKGGVVSGIDESTTRVLLSACSFEASHIRQTSQKLNLRTDASKRFENNVPAARVRVAFERFAQLVSDTADGTLASDALDVYSRPQQPYKVGLRPEHARALLGSDVTSAKCQEILARLGCDVQTVTPRDYVLEHAQEYLEAPYVYGASVSYDAPEAFDCSSFSSWLFVQAGIALPRTTAGQFVYTKEISEEELAPGDLVFSNTKRDEGGVIYTESKFYRPGTEIPGGVDHCGIYLGDGEIIHASRHANDEAGGVAVEKLAEAEQFENITKYGRVPQVEAEHIVATVPDWRPDLRKPCDLIEEIGRVQGYESIASELPEVSADSESVGTSQLTRAKEFLAARGFSEVQTYAFAREGEIKLKNPASEETAYLRTTLRDNLTQVRAQNKTHLPTLAADELAIFEIGKVFSVKEEVFEIGVACGGDSADERAEAAVSELAEIAGVELSITIDDGIATAQISDIDTLDLPAGERGEYPPVQFRTPSKFPYILRDIAVWTPAGTTPAEVEEIISETTSDLLVALNLFDTYEKDDQVSYAFKLVFQSDERTLSDEEVNKQMAAVEKALEGNDGFSVR